MPTRVADSADVHADASIGDHSVVWHLAQVREAAVIGTNCTVGRGAYIGAGVHVGNNVKIQNFALIYEPCVLEDGVFIGPAAVLTNDTHPRAVHPDGTLKSKADWTAVGSTVREGASVGAGSVCVAPVTIGRWALVAAGSVVTRDAPDHALMAGTPARRIGWVGRAGVPLTMLDDHMWVCPRTGEHYREENARLNLEPPA